MTDEIAAGQIYVVGENFWINESDFIGFASDAAHGDGLDKNPDCPGAAGIGATITVLTADDNRSIVRLDWLTIPIGARAPIGTVFRIDNARILGWGSKIDSRLARDAQRAATMAQLREAGLA